MATAYSKTIRSTARLLVTMLLVALLVAGAGGLKVSAAALSQEQRSELIALTSDALIASSDRQADKVADAAARIRTLWNGLGAGAGAGDSSSAAKDVTSALTGLEQELGRKPSDQAKVSQAVSQLAKAMDAYVSSSGTDAASGAGRKQAQPLVGLAGQSLEAARAGEWTKALQQFAQFVTGWGQAEGAIRKDDARTYGAIEVKISGARIALGTEPPDQTKVVSRLQELKETLQAFIDGKAASSTSTTNDINSIDDLLALVDAASADVEAGRADAAADKLEQFAAVWPDLEGAVKTKSAAAYTRIETQMVTIPSLLLSNPPKLEEAGERLSELRKELEPYAGGTSYSAWDAGAVLFREGVEAILIIAALLTYIRRSGHADKRRWIWLGSGAGILVSALGAVALSYVWTGVSAGSSRELIEGITGLVAVVFMVIVGAWLHQKSSLQAWNRFVERTVGETLRTGALWSLAFTSFLAVMREGAETILFYFGMAPSIEPGQMAVGIVGALLLLALIGFLIMALGARLPVRLFFRVAGLVLYYLAFKFIGTGVHALQISGKLPSHAHGYVPNLPAVGLYANWETTIPQVVLVVVLVWSLVRTERNSKHSKHVAGPDAQTQTN